MIPRRLPPVVSPLDAGGLLASALAAAGAGQDPFPALRNELAGHFSARDVVLTDSGTSALVLAMQLVAGQDGRVALPAYGCADLVSAARFAKVHVRLYDVDPVTLSPDLDSLRAALHRGVDAVVIAHFYGYAADVEAATQLASAAGAAVIEDAAQAAGGRAADRPLGSLAGVSVLSFGRGKGITGGSGGALLVRGSWHNDVANQVENGSAGWKPVIVSAAQWVLARPSLYSLPASIPALKLGEMIYHPAHAPRGISRSAAALVRLSLQSLAAAAARRRERAERIVSAVKPGGAVRTITPIPESDPGYLRLPLLVEGAIEAPDLGVLRAYPLTLFEQRELHPCLIAGETEHPGARELRRTLVTAPTHDRISDADEKRLMRWISRSASRTAAPQR